MNNSDSSEFTFGETSEKNSLITQFVFLIF